MNRELAMRVDAVVLGAGIIGVSTAIHLQQRGRSTLLIDRRGVAEETSFGNAGLIQREGVYPYGFPHDFGALLRYATNRTIDAHYHWGALPKLAPFLWAYWMHSRPAKHQAIAHQYEALIKHCISEHDALAQAAGATHLLHRKGWLKAFRSTKERDARVAEAARWSAEFGLNYKAYDAAQLRELEPHLEDGLIGGLHWTDPVSVTDPGGLGKAYLALFQKLGGQFMGGDATSLRQDGDRWAVTLNDGTKVMARDCVVALGPWADTVTRNLGYRLPLAVKRGYHMHYAPLGNAVLNHPVLDHERGYFLAPMVKGVRLTTGAEFAHRDAPPTPVQLERAEPIAKGFFPLGERLDATPWMGCRPCTPDMMPIIGAAHQHENLWFAFGHAHHGLTLGGITGRLIGEMVTGEKTIIDPKPFAPERFG
jgi:D-amino-acid dehydrogenase